MIPFAVPPAAGRSVSFVAAGTAGIGTDIGALPVGWVADQVAIFAIASYNDVSIFIPSHATPAGWTLIGSATDTDSDGFASRVSVYRRRLVALDTNPQATASTAIGSNTGIITYSGVHASTPTEGATTANDGANGGALPAYLTVTTTGPNRMLVQVVAGATIVGSGGTGSGTPGYYWSERLEAVDGTNVYFRIDDRRVYPAGTHPPVTSPSVESPGLALTRANVAFALIPA
jgi:hypothetical protein